ncbi:MAG: hypothetical protein K9M81_03250 [Chthoniobacterales bacterium]|nr:hypothetical protein [Chthoniobacterales bacterium]
MCTHCPRKTSRSTQHPSDILASAGDRYEICGLTRIFHTKSIPACGKLIITALVSNCDWGGRDSYSPASQFFTCLVLISFARRLMTLQYEVSGLKDLR